MHSLQLEIINKLLVQPEIDPELEFRKSVNMLKEYVIKYPFIKSFVLGISGGQDSSLCGYIAQTAVNELNNETNSNDYLFVAVSLPYGIQADEEDRQQALQFIQPSINVTVNIKPAVDASVQAVEKASGKKLSNFLKGNTKARERMKVQYDLAGVYQGVVLGTDHAAEAVTGFFTKHGDGAADLVPLYRLNKRQGRKILEYLGAPKEIYLKVPTADLEDDKPLIPDEDALGVTYDEIDDYLEGKEIRVEAAEKIENWYTKTEHKRHEPINVYDMWWK